MKSQPKVGLCHEVTLVVGKSHLITFADEQMPAVLATPWLVAHLEYAARDSLAPFLETDERSVGTYVEIEHLAPVPEGLSVVCRARIIHVTGEVITFQVEAQDKLEMVARGIHRRRVVSVSRLARRIQSKAEKMSAF